MTTLESIQNLQARMSNSIIGQEAVVKKIITVLLADGNLLMEGLPGLAKTRAIKSLAKELDCGLSRIQFTPDLLPSDITGTEIYQPDTDEKFIFQKGPIFSNLILADEINRAPAKVQAALLEAMEERQVSVAGTTHKMEDLFMVMATQNPVEQEGTYPLPEAQMDRFLMKVVIDYPSNESEIKILRLVKGEAQGSSVKNEPLAQEVIFAARKEIQNITVSENMEKYVVDLIGATRFPEKYSEQLSQWIEFGASPRGTIALEKCARVVAWLGGRDFVSPDDVREVIHEVLRHRLMLSYEASAEGVSAEQVIDELLKVVAVAKVELTSIPNITISLDDLNRQEHLFNRYAILANKNVYSILAGRHASKLRGRGLDFEEVRKYVAGDDIRNIDWNVTARTRTTYTKVFNEEKERPSYCVLDQSASMFFGSKKFTKSYVAAQLSAIAGFKVLKSGDRFGGLVFNDETMDFIHPKRSRKNLLHYFNYVKDYNQKLLDRDKSGAKPKNRLNEVLHKVSASVTHDHVIVIISDFLSIDEQTKKYLLSLTKHNDVICMLVRDPLEKNLPNKKMLIGDGEKQALWKGEKTAAFEKEMTAQDKDFESKMLKYGIPTLIFNTGEEVSQQMKSIIQKAMRG